MPAPAPAPSPNPLAADDSIKAAPLSPVDAAWVGTLDESAHPLPQQMWQGTPRTLVAAALPQLAATTSPTLQQLSRRLLLSNAGAPQGGDPAGGPSLAALRVGRLAALGDVDDALAVIEALPTALRDESLERETVSLHFARNDVPSACRAVQDGIALYQGVWWDRALVACQALAGDREKAALGLSLLREQNAPADPGFDALVSALRGRGVKLDKLAEPSPLLLTLLAAAKLPLPPDAVASADLASLRGWASNETVPVLQRLPAAERAAAFGALQPDALGELYAKVEFKPDELGAAIKRMKPPTSSRERALLYQVARGDPAAAVRAAALQALLAEAKKRGQFVAAARLLAPIVAELPAGDELAGFAPDAVRALYAAGRGDAASEWLARVDAQALPGLAALVALTAGKTAGDAARPLVALALMSALDEAPPPEAWASQIGGPHEASLPNAALWFDQQQAAAAKRLGETVLATLILSRAGVRLSGEPIVLGRIIEGLKAVGLAREARALALEAAVDAGL